VYNIVILLMFITHSTCTLACIINHLSILSRDKWITCAEVVQSLGFFRCAWVFVIAVTVGNAVRGAETSKQCRWAECGNGSRWHTAFSPVVAKAGSGGVQPWETAVGAASLSLFCDLCECVVRLVRWVIWWKKSAVWLHILVGIAIPVYGYLTSRTGTLL
jgi:hypothetical protein